MADVGPRVRALPTGGLDTGEVEGIRRMLDEAFTGEDAFGEEDWEHSLGGIHVVADLEGEVVGHAAVVERQLHVGGRPLRSGYVEAVATAPRLQGRGIGTRVMRAVGAHIAASFELGALATGSHRFYERLGWRTWQGPTWVRTPDGDRRTPDADGFVLVLLTPRTPRLEPDAPISCEWRPGDVW